ncbi:MAG: DUF167 domain-containing protein [Methanothrix sp.]|nr:DUF167 domain-containing protein [Methanothrix sp.]
MDLKGAILPHPQGCTIRLEVSPGSKELGVPSGFDPWRGALQARLTEDPSRGRANLQLTEEMARVLGVSGSEVRILSGHRSTSKVLLIRGLDPGTAASILGRRLEGSSSG